MTTRPRDNWKDIIELTKQGVPRTEVAARLKISVATIRNILRPHGLLNDKRVSGGRKGARSDITSKVRGK